MTGETQLATTMCLRQWPGSVSSLLSVSLFKFITWDKSQLVGLGIPLRFIAKPSYAGHCASTHVAGNCQ
jgi:hypothetical protein